MLAIIAPYRDRQDHLEQFIPRMNKFIPDAKIVIVEQVDDGKPFNRGKLLNVGFLETEATHYCFHDLDKVILEHSAYLERPGVNQLISSVIQRVDYLGGVTMFEWKSFTIAEGYQNDYFHRAEDNEMMFNLKRKNIPVAHWNFLCGDLPHPRTGPEFIPELWAKAQIPRNINMLENCRYELISKEVFDTHTHLKVML